MTASLYEEDFYAWTQQQAELLRRLPPVGNELDIENIAEEIEDLGRSDLRAARSLCEIVILRIARTWMNRFSIVLPIRCDPERRMIAW